MRLKSFRQTQIPSFGGVCSLILHRVCGFGHPSSQIVGSLVKSVRSSSSSLHTGGVPFLLPIGRRTDGARNLKYLKVTSAIVLKEKCVQ